jgi:long-chain fatty acid transport protein
MKAKGMAGASTTNTDDAMGGANNPAAMAFAGNRFDLGVDLFSPQREASRTGSTGFGPFPAINGSSDSDSNYFLIPELGYTHQVNNNLALGVTVYGNRRHEHRLPGSWGVRMVTTLGGSVPWAST